MTHFAPTDLDELREAVAAALAAGEPVELIGGGSKRGLGRPLQLPHVLDLSRLAGIRDYEPSELTLTAGAATPLAEIERELAAAGQMLAFEPPDWRGLLGGEGEPTLGGVLACNLSGPRRVKAGAARDHFLGCRAVSGRGEAFKAGGRVVKNVTGYDLCKLLAGSYGTLAALEEVTVKVLPRPEAAATVLCRAAAPEDAVRVMAAALASPHEISGAACLPQDGKWRCGSKGRGPRSPSAATAWRASSPPPRFSTATIRRPCGATSAPRRRSPAWPDGRCGASRRRRAAAPGSPPRWSAGSARPGCSTGAAGWCGRRCRKAATAAPPRSAPRLPGPAMPR